MEGGESTFIETNGIRLHVMQFGDPNGEVAILLHGFPDFWYSWRHQIPVLVKAGYRLLVPDQRGYNLSDKPRGVHHYSIRELVKDILGLIDTTGRQQVTLISHDWGGVVALALTTWYPERVKRQVVVNAPHYVTLLKAMLTNPEQLQKSSYILRFQVPLLEELKALASQFSNWSQLLPVFCQRAGVSSITDDELLKYEAAWRQPRAFTCALNWYRSLAREHLFRPLEAPKITVPSMLFWGKEDLAFTLELGEETAAVFQDVKYDLVEDGHHWLQWSHKEELNQKILEFLSTS